MTTLPGTTPAEGSETSGTWHQPVMAAMAAEMLLENGGNRYVDCTVGSGGHAEEIMQQARREIHLLGIDLDGDAIEAAKGRLGGWSGVTLTKGSYVDLDRHIDKWGEKAVDGVLADFGQSSLQLDDPRRGFTHRYNGPLDMRYDATKDVTAADLINSLPAEQLAMIISQLGEERGAARIAAAICHRRPIHTTSELREIVLRNSPARYATKTLARVFMALRIAVNDELTQMDALFPVVLRRLAPRGRMVFISYDSHQDRRVKVFFAGAARHCTCPPELPVCVCGSRAQVRILTRRVIRPDASEIRSNPRSRSARLRSAERLAE